MIDILKYLIPLDLLNLFRILLCNSGLALSYSERVSEFLVCKNLCPSFFASCLSAAHYVRVQSLNVRVRESARDVKLLVEHKHMMQLLKLSQHRIHKQLGLKELSFLNRAVE